MSIRIGNRISYCGSGGTGKSTSAKFLAQELRLPLIKSAARSVYEERNLSEESVQAISKEGKLELQKEIFDKKIELDKQYEYVADRTILDHYCYALAYCSSFMDNSYFLEMEEKVRQLMLSTYSYIFYFPFGYWFPKSDNVRQDHLSWQSMIDALLVGYIIRWGLSVTTVPQMYEEDYRNEFILKTIKGEK
ncbi:MAG: AAA family ATPase [Candidatus Hodarchaeota archaeon]